MVSVPDLKAPRVLGDDEVGAVVAGEVEDRSTFVELGCREVTTGLTGFASLDGCVQ